MKEKIKSGYKGVHLCKRGNVYKASITYLGITYACGSAETPREAAKLRDRKILALNFPQNLLQVLTPKKELI